jgi:ABC-type lipoprotein export system ATPase subunit
MLQADALRFAYRSGAPLIVDGWSAEFPAGTTTALTGPSGCGKSTLLYLLGLMLSPSAGELRVAGVPASRLGDAAKSRMRAHHFGFVFQDAALDPSRTVMDNVTEAVLYRGSAAAAARARAAELLEQFGVDVPANRKPGQVSGGQAQRIALCRALLGRPDIVLADEPTGNLDPETADVVVDALRDHAAGGAAVIIVTHSPDVADACDRRIALA